MSFVVIAFIMGGFLTLYGLIFLYVSSQVRPPEAIRLVHPKVVFGLLAALYFCLAHVSVLVGSGESLYLTNQAPCSFEPNHTTEIYQYGNNFTGYHWDYDTGTAPDGPQTDAYLFHRNITVASYVDTCADRAVPSAAENLHVIFLYLLWLDLTIMFIGMLYGLGYLLRRW